MIKLFDYDKWEEYEKSLDVLNRANVVDSCFWLTSDMTAEDTIGYGSNLTNERWIEVGPMKRYRDRNND